MATILGSSAIIGSVDFAYKVGWAGSWLLISASIGLILLYLLIDKLERFQIYNLPELLGKFYGKEIEKLASFLIPIAWLGIVASQIIGGAKVIMILSSLKYKEAVLLIGMIFIVYTTLGGQISIIKTDFIQLVFILIGILGIAIYITNDTKIISGLGIINEKFDIMDIVVLILTYSTSYLVGPDIYSRLFCSRNIKVMKKSLVLTIIILVMLGLILSKIGIYGYEILENVELKGNSILLMLATEKLPNPISYILYYGLISAIISSADTTLFTASSLFTQVFLVDLKGKKAITITRIFIVIFGVIAIFIALHLSSILEILLLTITIYTGAFLAPTFLGVIGIRTKKKKVILVIFLGGIVALIGKIIGGNLGKIILILNSFLNMSILLIGREKN